MGGEGEGSGEKDGRTHKEKKEEKGKWSEEWRKIEIQLKDAAVDKESSGIDEWRKEMDE